MLDPAPITALPPLSCEPPQSAHPDNAGFLPARAQLDRLPYALLLITIRKLQPEIRTDLNEEWHTEFDHILQASMPIR